MAISAIVFDIGGVLEITPDTGLTERWAARLHLRPGELDARMAPVWRAGSLGHCSEEDVRRSLSTLVGLDRAQVDAFMRELWDEFLGTLDGKLAAYFAGLRPRYRTALLSNSFVGAREREQERYGFAEMSDLIIYSHEVGVAKPEQRIYELTWQRLGVQPGEVVFLDDVAANVAAAGALGLQAILFRDTDQAITDIQACLQAHAS